MLTCRAATCWCLCMAALCCQAMSCLHFRPETKLMCACSLAGRQLAGAYAWLPCAAKQCPAYTQGQKRYSCVHAHLQGGNLLVPLHGYPVMNGTKLMRACSLAGWQLAGAYAWLSGDERNQDERNQTHACMLTGRVATCWCLCMVIR